MEPSAPIPEQSRTNWFSKSCESALALRSAIAIYLMLLVLMPEKWQNSLGGDLFYEVWTMGAVFLLGIIYGSYWHWKEKKGKINSGLRHAWFQALLRFYLAMEISTYGFAKILGTQFAHVYYRDDMPVASLNGFNLTWNYFSYSYPMAVIIALVQVIGSILLLFRRTTLLGVTMLLPVMLNILLINVFYDIAVGAFVNSILYTLGLIYLLSRHWAPLKKVYLNAISSLPKVKMGPAKIVLKVICIAAAYALIYSYTLQNVKSPLEGKWKVVSMLKNGDSVSTDAWRTDSTAWVNMYFEAYGRAAFSPNPYVFERKKATMLGYKFDTLKKTIQFDLKDANQVHDTTEIAILKYTPTEIEWKGRIGKDTFLVKMKPEKKRTR